MAPSTDMPECYRVGDLLIDTATRQITRDGRFVALPSLSFDLLIELVRHAPRVISVDELMKQVWSGRVVNAETVAKRVELVREALGDDSHEPRYIALVRGRGYRLLAAVVPVERPAQELTPLKVPPALGGPAPAMPSVRDSPAPRARSFRLPVAWAALAVVVLAAATWMALRAVTSGDRRQTAANARPMQNPSVAVLPFLNLSDDASNAYLSDGIAEELLGALAHTPHLRVVSRTSSFAFRNKETPLPQIAGTLRVTHILEGSVRKSGNRIRISAQLIEVASDSHLWAQTYDTELKDVLEVEDQISRSIVSAMRAKLGAEGPGPANSPSASTQNVDAYELFLRGRQLWYIRGENNIRQSIQLLERAIELDPQFAGAHAALAQAYSTVNYWYGEPDEHAIEAATRSAARAIELDPTLSDAYAAQGEVAEQQMQWQQAEAAFRRAIELNANDSTARTWLGELLFVTGRTHDALPAMLQALELDPTSARLLEYVGVLHLVEGDFDQGCPYIKRAAELTVNTTAFPWWYLVRCLEHAGKLQEAREAERIGERVAGFTRPALTLVRRAMENPDEKAAALEAIREDLPPRLRITFGMPGLIQLGEYDGALDIVEAALRQHNDTALMILWQPEAQGLRAQPRFGKLVERIGLVEYWRRRAWADRCRPRAASFECN